MAGQLGDSWSDQERLLSDAAAEDRRSMEGLINLFTAVSRIRHFIAFPWTSVSPCVLI